MNKMEMIYWFIFSFGFISFILVYISYKKSFEIIQPIKKSPITITPENFYLPYEKVFFHSSDGVELSGWFIQSVNGESDKTIVLCHGWGSNKGEILKDTYFLAENGFNLFYFDFRTAGESKGNIASVGYLEVRDLDGAIKFLKEVKSEESRNLSLYGCSMGGSVVIYTAAHFPDIKCLITESAFFSYKNVIKNWSWGRLKVPYFPLVLMTLYFVKMKLKVDTELYSPSHNVMKLNIPVLFINGDNDDIVPVSEAKKLFDYCSSKEKDLWIVKGSSHAKCPEVAGNIFVKKVIEFYQKYS